MLSFLRFQKNVINSDLSFTKKKFERIKFCLLILSSLFTIWGQAQIITVTNVSPSPICAGSNVTITFTATNSNRPTGRFSNSTVYTVFLSNGLGTGFTQIGSTFSTSGVNYAGGNGGVTTGITTTVTIPASAGTGRRYRISLSSSGPNFNGGTGRGASPVFRINAPPTAVAGTQVFTCSTSGAVNITTGASATTQNSVTWTSSGTGTFTNANSLTNARYRPSAADITAGSVTLTLTATGPCGNASSTKTLTINRPPTIADAGLSQTGAATCGLTMVTLAANTPVVGTGNWDFAPTNTGTGGSFGNASSPVSTFTGTPGSTYTLRWTIANNPCPASSSNVIITFNQNPTTANAGSDQLVCGSLTTLTANTPVIGTGNWTIVSGTGGSLGDVTSPTSTFNGTKGSTYTLRWTIANTPCIASTDDVNIKIRTVSPVVAKLYSRTAAGCNGIGGTIKIDARNGHVPFTFSLTGDATRTQNSNNFTGLNAGTYSVSVTDSKGCTATVSNITVAQSTPPAANLYRNIPASCNGDDGSITISPNGGHRPYTFSLNGGSSQTSNIFSGLAPDNYSVTVTDAKNCTATVSGIEVLQPSLTAKLHGITSVSCMSGTDGSITVGPTGGVRPYQYSLTGPVNRDFQTGNMFSNLPAGTYTVIVRDSKGCTNSVNAVIKDGTVACLAAKNVSPVASDSKLNTDNNTFKVQATPNPSRTDFTLNLQSSSKERVQIIVTDMFGKKLYQTTGSANQRYIFGKEFRSGVYIVQVIRGKEIQTLKLIKGN